MYRENREFIGPTLSEQLPTTLTSLKPLRDEGFRFPQRLKDSKILDIGAGATTVPIELRAKGAIVHALDIKYKDIISVEEAVTSIIEEMRQRLRKEKSLSDQIMALSYFNEIKKSVLEDMRENPSSYVYGSMFDIPFEDNTFNFVFSSMCIDRAGSDTEIGNALREAYRVTQPHGEIQIGPVGNDVISGYQEFVDENFPGARLKHIKSKIVNEGVVQIFKK